MFVSRSHMIALASACTLLWSAAPAEGSTPKRDDGYKSRLRQYGARLDVIQQGLETASARVQALRDYIVKDVNPKAWMIVRFEDRMGSTFEPVSVLVTYNGELVGNWSKAAGTLKSGTNSLVFSKEVTVGPSALKVVARYRGVGGLPYMKDYAFRLNRLHRFTAQGGRITTLTAYGYQRGDATYDPSQRPWLGFETSRVDYTRENLRRVMAEQMKLDGAAPAPKRNEKNVEEPSR